MQLLMLNHYPQYYVHATLILDRPFVDKLPNIQASNSRFCPIDCAHHLVHHRRSAEDTVSHHPHSVIGSAYLPPQSLKPLLLRLGVDPGANDKSNDVEEGDPGMLGQELLGKGQCQGRDDPADFHDRHEAGSNGCSDLVEGPGAGDDSHGGKIDCILNRCDLQIA